jgi:uncharacterized membrane protein
MTRATIDRGFGGLLVVGSLLHAMGSIRVYASQPTTLVWALSATMAGLLLATLNLVRAGRPHDRTLAWICLVGCLAWIAQSFAFGITIGSPFDARVLIHAINAAVLAGFAAVGLRQSPPRAQVA